MDDFTSESKGGMERFRLKSALVVEADPRTRNFLQGGLNQYFGLVESAADVASAELLYQRCHFDLLVVSCQLPARDGLEWIAELRGRQDRVGVIFITADVDVESAVKALRLSALEFLSKPVRIEQILSAVTHAAWPSALQQVSAGARLPEGFDGEAFGLIGDSPRFNEVCSLIERVAPMRSTILIEGESGTGKELAARAIHRLSGRNGSFVPINCAAMSAELLESELFGHSKGAFTGAHQSRDGLFLHADGGSLFLDEIGEMPLPMQAHLLRVLEEQRIRPVGTNQETDVNVRVIAATNRNLTAEVQQGRFRRDLYFRLDVLTISMPPLRERIEDLPLLVRHFARSLAFELGVEAPKEMLAQVQQLKRYHWPGNVRELRNVLERAILLGMPPRQYLAGVAATTAEANRKRVPDDLELASVEKRHILQVLEMEGGNKSAAARRLGISRKTLERKTRAWNAGVREESDSIVSPHQLP